MSGFLHRLAAQALGRTAPVRSASRLPYSQPVSFAETVSGYDERRSVRIEERDAIAPTRTTSASRDVPENRPDPTSVAREQPTSTQESAPRRTSPTQPAPAALIQQRTVTERSGEPSASPPPGLPSETESWTDDAAPDAPHQAPDAQAASGHWRDRAESRRPMHPTPLLKPATASAAGEQRLAPQPATARFGTVEETTEVHVSIGRIEVTAVHEAAPPRRPAPRAAKPTSLDDYLARRGASR